MFDYNLEQKIEEYSGELFADLGLVSLSEEEKADIYARLEEHLHEVIINYLVGKVRDKELRQVTSALEQENYQALNRALKKYPQYKQELDGKIEQEYYNLKSTIAEEQKHVTRQEIKGVEQGGELS